MSRRSLVERALVPAPCSHPKVSLRRGDVVSPGMVSTEPDDLVGSAVDGPAAEGAGMVLEVDGHRHFLPFGPVAPAALVAQVERTAEQVTATTEALSSTHEAVVETSERVAEVATEAHTALLHAALAMGLWIIPHDAPLPTVRRDGESPLELGDVVYQRNASTAKFTGVKFWDGSAWAPLVMAAEYLIAIESVVSDLIAAGVELTAPLITGGTVRTAASGARVELTSAGLKAYNASNAVTSEISGASGSFTGATFTGGIIRTAASGARVQIVGATNRVQMVGASNRPLIEIDPAFNDGVGFHEKGALVFRADVAGGRVKSLLSHSGLSFFGASSSENTRLFQDENNNTFYIMNNNSVVTTGNWIFSNQASFNSPVNFASAPLVDGQRQAPLILDRTFTDSTWPANGFLDAALSTWSPAYDKVPTAVIPFIASSPGGSGGLVPRMVSWNTNSAQLRVYNTNSAATTISGELSVKMVVIP